MGLNIARNSAAFQVPPSATTSSDLYSLANQLATQKTGPGVGAAYSQSGSPFALRLVVRPGNQLSPAFTSGQQVGFYGIPELPQKLVHVVDERVPE